MRRKHDENQCEDGHKLLKNSKRDGVLEHLHENRDAQKTASQKQLQRKYEATKIQKIFLKSQDGESS